MARRRSPSNELDRLRRALAVKPSSITTNDSFDTFINAAPIHISSSDPLEWWCHSMQREAFPRLSRMAIDLLSIPPESTEDERVLSGARRTASWDRLRISCANIEKIECIGNWLRKGFIVPRCRGGHTVGQSFYTDISLEEEILAENEL
jgi:hypothetical protein